MKSIPEAHLAKLHTLLTKCNFAEENEGQENNAHNKAKLQ